MKGMIPPQTVFKPGHTPWNKIINETEEEKKQWISEYKKRDYQKHKQEYYLRNKKNESKNIVNYINRRKIYSKKYLANHRIANKRYRQKNSEILNEKAREYYQKNIENIRKERKVISKRYYDKHRELSIQRSILYQKHNPIKVSTCKKYYLQKLSKTFELTNLGYSWRLYEWAKICKNRDNSQMPKLPFTSRNQSSYLTQIKIPCFISEC